MSRKGVGRRTTDNDSPAGGDRTLSSGCPFCNLEPERIFHEDSLVRGDKDPLLPRLLADLNRTRHVDLAVAFVQRSGVDLIYEHLRERLEAGGRIRLLTGDYLDITDPDSLLQLLDLKDLSERMQLRVFMAGRTSFHPKAYLFYNDEREGSAYVGSSNLTRSALGEGVEWNLRIDSSINQPAFREIRTAFEDLLLHPNTRAVDYDWIERYRKRRNVDRRSPVIEIEPDAESEILEPHDIQKKALAMLVKTREEGNSAGLVVLATGLGKTWLSAFDSNRPEYRRILFVAHREEILSQARRTFRKIRPKARTGISTGAAKDPDSEILFASIQTLSRTEHLGVFEPDEFDYVIIDEFHHAAARTYRRLIEYFTPRFLLGLTATPERTDGGDLLALCQENLGYRCDFIEGIRRGLRKGEKKSHLNVIDYIGNHRIFLVKIRSLLEPLSGVTLTGDLSISHALQQATAGSYDLPPGCSITYELRSVDIIDSILRKPKGAAAIETTYRDFRDRTGRRPMAVELYHEGYNPKAVRNSHGSWFQFVEQMRDLEDTQATVLNHHRHFLSHFEITSMTKSYKILVILAMLNRGCFPGEISISELTQEFRRLAERSAQLRGDIGNSLENDSKLASHIVKNPINAWTGTGAMGGTAYFTYEEDVLKTSFELEGQSKEVFQEMVRELADWRLAEYLDRGQHDRDKGEFVARVSHANGRPILFLPSREKHSGIPYGSTKVYVDKTRYEANFVKVALNVLRRSDSERNVLPEILRGWFGPDAGLPGTAHTVRFTPTSDGWEMSPARDRKKNQLELWKAYSTEEIPQFFGLEFNTGKWNQGFVLIEGHAFLLVTLDKGDMLDDHRYSDHFESRDTFVWQSQNQTKQESKHGQILRNHEDQGYSVHLFVQKTKKLGGRAAPFIYCGTVDFHSWENEQPITISWKLHSPLSMPITDRLGIAE